MLGRFQLKIYNVLGQEVADLRSRMRNTLGSAGIYNVIWDGSNKYGDEAGSGIYFICAKYARSTQIRKVVLLRERYALHSCRSGSLRS